MICGRQSKMAAGIDLSTTYYHKIGKLPELSID